MMIRERFEDLEKAQATKYAEKDGKTEEMKQAEEGLNERIRDYIDRIKSSDKKPRSFDKGGVDEH